MKNQQIHALQELTDAFLNALPEKFRRSRKDNVWTPQLTTFALLLLAFQGDDRGYESILSTIRTMREDLLEAKTCQSTFCRARQKITHEFLQPAWEALQQRMIDLFGDIQPHFHGYKILAIDGVWFNGRRAKKLFRQLRKRTPGRPPKDPKGQPQLLVVALVDAFTRTPIAWEAVMPNEGERTAAKRLLKHLDSKTILLADRGFPSREIFASLAKSGVKFLFRMTNGRSAFSEVTKFHLGQGRDRRVDLRIGKVKENKTIIARMIRGHPMAGTEIGKGKEWTLVTNIERSEAWSRKALLDLYHERWGIETFFRELKKLFGADHFHAHSLEGMETEITMAMVAGTLVSAAEMIALTITHERLPTCDDLKMERCNRSTLRTVVQNMLTSNPMTKEVATLIDRELEIAAHRARPRRPNRIYPRICKSFFGKWKVKFKKRAA